ncbi:hypothetical protein GDO78_022240 [Eleutherodactylus coqui]|uniref:Calponin-homology (CH) domain-containing protein n=1 Tax=Eleutherodactylus coqui TaxID=57060 RepID=A0A8J6B4U6_ELECQ|nr:hypothetical protein GDO78_022240 [Eleutherodactylus coqui]
MCPRLLWYDACRVVQPDLLLFYPHLFPVVLFQPKLNLVKCRKNVDSFLEACRRLGVPERDLCSARDVLGGERPLDVLRTVSSLLLCASEEGSGPPSEAATCPSVLLYRHHGFLLFYTLLMLVLYVVYSKLCSS